MDDVTLEALVAALRATPGNTSLLVVVVRELARRRAFVRAAELLPERFAAEALPPADRRVIAEVLVSASMGTSAVAAGSSGARSWLEGSPAGSSVGTWMTRPDVETTRGSPSKGAALGAGAAGTVIAVDGAGATGSGRTGATILGILLGALTDVGCSAGRGEAGAWEAPPFLRMTSTNTTTTTTTAATTPAMTPTLAAMIGTMNPPLRCPGDFSRRNKKWQPGRCGFRHGQRPRRH